jgi:hypothetical protein
VDDDEQDQELGRQQKGAATTKTIAGWKTR